MNVKKVIFLNMACLFFIFKVNANQNDFQNNTKYKQFGLIWGLLKYHDPAISSGDYNWDTVFLENINKIDSIKNQNELNNFLHEFLLEFINKEKLKPIVESKELFKKNKDYNWILTLPFTDEIRENLFLISNNSNIQNFYLSVSKLSKIPLFKNETGISNFNSVNKSHRLLTLFSFWNAINYWNVNKYLMNIKWYDQLDKFIPPFLTADSKLQYEIVKSKLIASLNDSHSYYVSDLVNDSLFKYKAPFRVKMVSDTLIVNYITNKALATKNNIKLGDLILQVNDLTILSSLKKRVGSILSHSNDSFLKKFANWIFFNKNDSIKVKIRRGENMETRYIKLYDNIQNEGSSYLKPKQNFTREQLIKDNIGYINLGLITKKELKKAFKKFEKTEGIIIDLKNYPKNHFNITKYIYPKKQKFIKVLFPIKEYPSYANFENNTLIINVKDPFVTGYKNPNYYKGKIILLVNKSTISKAEYIGMAIQASPNCITVGEQTAGSVMNIVIYKLPDGTPVSFTSLGAFYPDGISAQKNGLKIDYIINETTSNFLDNLYITKAIELIKNK